MNLEVAGVKIAIDGSAWFANYTGVPVFHAWSPPRGSGAGAVTRCGRLIAQLEDGRVKLQLTPIPPRHAVRFGRPCTICWPQLRRQQSLFTRPRRPRQEGEQETLELDG